MTGGFLASSLLHVLVVAALLVEPPDFGDHMAPGAPNVIPVDFEFSQLGTVTDQAPGAEEPAEQTADSEAQPTPEAAPEEVSSAKALPEPEPEPPPAPAANSAPQVAPPLEAAEAPPEPVPPVELAEVAPEILQEPTPAPEAFLDPLPREEPLLEPQVPAQREPNPETVPEPAPATEVAEVPQEIVEKPAPVAEAEQVAEEELLPDPVPVAELLVEPLATLSPEPSPEPLPEPAPPVTLAELPPDVVEDPAPAPEVEPLPEPLPFQATPVEQPVAELPEKAPEPLPEPVPPLELAEVPPEGPPEPVPEPAPPTQVVEGPPEIVKKAVFAPSPAGRSDAAAAIKDEPGAATPAYAAAQSASTADAAEPSATEDKQQALKPGMAPTAKLTGSQLDALRSQLRQHWRAPPNAHELEGLKVKVTITMNPDRTPKDVQIVDMERYNGDRRFRILADSAVEAVWSAGRNKLKLPPEKYDLWWKITVTFDLFELATPAYPVAGAATVKEPSGAVTASASAPLESAAAAQPPAAATVASPDPAQAPQEGGSTAGAPTAPVELTKNEIRNLRDQFKRLWKLPDSLKTAKNMKVKVKIVMNPDRVPRDVFVVDTERYENDAEFRALADSVLAAIQAAGKEKFAVPSEKYAAWSEITMTFDPRTQL